MSPAGDYSDYGPTLAGNSSTPLVKPSHATDQIATAGRASGDVAVSIPAPTGRLQSLSELQGLDTWDNAQVLEFRDLSYQVSAMVRAEDGRKERRKVDILKGVTGSARTGELMAVMGPSGAGKSSFLDAVAGRIRPESLQGTLSLNGVPAHTRIKKLSAYVQQDDELFPTLTVEETLLFSAGVRLPAAIPLAEKRARVQQLMRQLGLERVAGTIIGDAVRRGISGGERRRVSIGVDIIHDPAILFLDEPTSGLDSSAALSVVERLSSIARAGSLVVCTLHQPSFRILDLLDSLLVLARGQVVYLGSPSALPLRLEEAGVVVPAHANGAELIMDLLQPHAEAAHGKTMESLIALNKTAAQLAADSRLGPGTHRKFGEADITDQSGSAVRGSDSTSERKFVNGFATELWWVMWRASLSIRRTPPLFLVRIINVMITAIMLASLFWRPNRGAQGAQNLVAFTVFALCLVYFTSNDALAIFIQERLIFIRESSHYAYRTSSYVVGNMFVFLPFLLLLAVLFNLMCWWTVDLAGGAAGFFFWVFVLFCAFFTANSFVSFLSAIVPNLEIGNTVALAVTAYFLLLSGFFIKRTEIPAYWLWIHYLSTLKWPYQALMLEQFDRDGCYVTGEDGACTLSGRDLIKTLAVDELSKWACCGFLLLLGVGYRFAFYVVLRISTNSKRK